MSEVELFGENQNLISMSLVSNEDKEPTQLSFRVPRGQEIIDDSSEIDEVPISDPPATRRRTWSESSAGLADQLISPTSVAAGAGFSLETSGECPIPIILNLNLKLIWRCGKGVLPILSS